MADLTFSQPARRNFAAPVLLALLVLAIAVALILRFTPHTTADASVSHVQTYAAHTVFKSDSIVVGHDQAEDDLYVLATVTLTDRLRLPLFLKDFTATLTPAQGDPITVSATEKPDLQGLYAAFPAVKALADSAPAPLYRETTVQPGQTVTGTIFLHFPVAQDVWNSRQSATLSIVPYHQAPIVIDIPKS